MNQDFIKEQKELALKEIEKLGNTEGQKKQQLSVVFQFLSSLLEPEEFTEAEKEDLRKLALEMSFEENTKFEDWCSTLEAKQKS